MVCRKPKRPEWRFFVLLCPEMWRPKGVTFFLGLLRIIKDYYKHKSTLRAVYLAYRFWLTVEDDTDIAQKDRGFYTQLLRCGHRVWYRVWSHLRNNNEGCDWRWHWRKLFRGQNVALCDFRNVPNMEYWGSSHPFPFYGELGQRVAYGLQIKYWDSLGYNH